MSNSSDDKLLDEYLNGATPYSSHYRRIESDGVPPEVDRAVMREAARRASGRRSEMWLRVAPALAIAATAVLTVSIVIRSGRELAPTTAERVESIEQPAPTRQEKDETLVEQSRADVAAPSAPSFQGATSDAKEKVRAKKDSAPKDNALKESATDKLAMAPRDAISTVDRPVEKPAEVVSRQKLETIAQQRRQESTPPAEAPAGNLQPFTSADADQRTAAAASVSAAGAAPASIPPPPEQLTRAQAIANARARDEAKKSSTELAEVVVTGSFIRGNSQNYSEPKPVSVPPSESINRTKPSPWLRYIRLLRKADRDEEADVEWKDFVAAFPNYSVSKRDAARPATER